MAIRPCTFPPNDLLGQLEDAREGLGAREISGSPLFGRAFGRCENAIRIDHVNSLMSPFIETLAMNGPFVFWMNR
jgi:hypothetical protein